MNAKESRGQSDNGGVSWLFFAKLHTRWQSASPQPCRQQRPTGHLNPPRTRYFVPSRSHNGRAKSVDAIGTALAERKRTSSAFPVARPFFSLGSPTQICRPIPVKASADWNTCPVSSSRDLPAAAPSPAAIFKTRIFHPFPVDTLAPTATSATDGLPMRRWTLVGLGGQRASSSDFSEATFITSNV